MKKAEEMNLPELREAYEESTRNQPHDTCKRIENNPCAHKDDSSLITYAKDLYRRIKELETPDGLFAWKWRLRSSDNT